MYPSEFSRPGHYERMKSNLKFSVFSAFELLAVANLSCGDLIFARRMFCFTYFLNAYLFAVLQVAFLFMRCLSRSGLCYVSSLNQPVYYRKKEKETAPALDTNHD